MTHNCLRDLAVALIVPSVIACDTANNTAPQADSQVLVTANTVGSVAGLVVNVSGPGINPTLVFNVPVAADRIATDTLVVPAGGARRFILTAIDSTGLPTHRADTTMNLVAGVRVPLAITLLPLSSRVGITITFGAVR